MQRYPLKEQLRSEETSHVTLARDINNEIIYVPIYPCRLFQFFQEFNQQKSSSFLRHLIQKLFFNLLHLYHELCESNIIKDD